jgi:predicted Zn finger-like uncharacterized protein
MKIVCDACQAKYSISDDKVQGKVFKIRCKKCSNIIVVRGGAGAAEPAPAQEKDTRVYDYGYEGGDHAPAGDESVWHVVINQDQVGPMTAVEVQQRYSAGEIDSETYIWREGFADWLPLAQVDTFAALAAVGAAGTGPGAASRGGGGSEAVASMFGGGEAEGTGRSDPGDLFAAASANARRDDDGDLFGSKPGTAPNQAGAKLRGERNENSVLFSLNNLAQLASDKPAPAASHAAMPTPAAATGASGGEGSGLIDIRSMATAYLGGGSGGPAKPVSASIGSIDDLPVFGGGGFSEPAVIVPMTQRASNNKLMYALIGSVGLLAVAAVIVVVVLLKGGDKTPAVAVVTPTEVKPSVTPETRPPDSSAQAKLPEPKPPETKPPETTPPSTPGNAKLPVAATEPPPEKHTVTPPPVHRPAQVAVAPTTPKPAKPDRPAPTKPDPPPTPAKSGGGDSGCDEISCVLNNNEGPCCAKFAKGKKPGGTAAKPASGGGDLPERLDRAMIADGIGKVRGQVMSCGDKSPAKGTVKVSVKVGADGRISSVDVKETPDPALGNCVKNQVQKATFAKTQSGGSFAYPYPF